MRDVIYRVDFPFTPEVMQGIEDSMSIDDLKVIKMVKINSYDDVNSEGNVVSYMIGDKSDFDIIFSFLKSEKIKYGYIDIADGVLMGEYDFHGTSIEKDVNKFIKENLTVDIVLDKINIKGMESLNVLDKTILGSF